MEAEGVVVSAAANSISLKCAWCYSVLKRWPCFESLTLLDIVNEAENSDPDCESRTTRMRRAARTDPMTFLQNRVTRYPITDSGRRSLYGESTK